MLLKRKLKVFGTESIEKKESIKIIQTSTTQTDTLHLGIQICNKTNHKHSPNANSETNWNIIEFINPGQFSSW